MGPHRRTKTDKHFTKHLETEMKKGIEKYPRRGPEKELGGTGAPVWRAGETSHLEKSIGPDVKVFGPDVAVFRSTFVKS